jgi:hypothetical protein
MLILTVEREQVFKLRRLISIILVIGIFYFSFMILDRALSLIFGFNFQPYGPHMPPGFTFWGHLANGSAAALGLFLTFKIYDYGKKKDILFFKILPFVIFGIIGALIPYMNDSNHLEKNGMGHTLPYYVIANDLYVFFTGFLAYRVARSNKARSILLLALAIIFVIIHFLFYAPMFPEFYWS